MNYFIVLIISLVYMVLSSCDVHKQEVKTISNSSAAEEKSEVFDNTKESAQNILIFKMPPMPEKLESESIRLIDKSILFTDPIPLSGEETLRFLDIRGVGDSGMGYTHTQPYKLTDKILGVNADFAERLDNFDSTGKSYRGDLSFINWESSIGTHCKEFWAPRNGGAFAFMSHPDNVVRAYQKGFNIIGLANNHTRDCPCSDNSEYGALVSANHMKRLTEELQANWLWHGVGIEKNASARVFDIKGNKIKVAFANIYMGGGDCSYVSCQSDEVLILNSLKDIDADIRILAIHSWNNDTHNKLIDTGTRFIKYYKGDIVFGNGPHNAEPIKIIESPVTGKKGVMFESLGNFIHPSLKAGSNNIIGRVLFDLYTMELCQIQIIPINVNRITVNFSSIKPIRIDTDILWKKIEPSKWQNEITSPIQGYYYNVVE